MHFQICTSQKLKFVGKYQHNLIQIRVFVISVADMKVLALSAQTAKGKALCRKIVEIEAVFRDYHQYQQLCVKQAEIKKKNKKLKKKNKKIKQKNKKIKTKNGRIGDLERLIRDNGIKLDGLHTKVDYLVADVKTAVGSRGYQAPKKRDIGQFVLLKYTEDADEADYEYGFYALRTQDKSVNQRARDEGAIIFARVPNVSPMNFYKKFREYMERKCEIHYDPLSSNRFGLITMTDDQLKEVIVYLVRKLKTVNGRRYY